MMIPLKTKNSCMSNIIGTTHPLHRNVRLYIVPLLISKFFGVSVSINPGETTLTVISLLRDDTSNANDLLIAITPAFAAQ